MTVLGRGRGPTSEADAERTYYRIVRNPTISEDDFKSARDLGKPLRDPRLARQWAEGVSVYGTFEHAIARARQYRYKLGRHVVTVTLPADANVEVEQSGHDPYHYTLYGVPDQLQSFASDPARRIDEE